jgi:Holliday junction resolvase
MSSRRGHQRERDLVRLLREDDDPWIALRAPASLGVADVLAVRRGEILLLELKSTSAPSPFSAFGPADRRALLDAAATAGGDCYLVHWPPRRPPRWIPPEEWPPTP